jgi:hypothetical protein
MTHILTDYYVFTSRRGDRAERWSWEIRRKSKSLGIKLTGDGFQPDAAAQFARKKALEDFSTTCPSKKDASESRLGGHYARAQPRRGWREHTARPDARIEEDSRRWLQRLRPAAACVGEV